MTDKKKLSDRVRPSVEAAPWVVNAIKKLEYQLEAMQGTGEAAAYIPVDRETGEQWPPQKHKGNGTICDYIPLFKRQPAVDAAPVAPVEIEYPTYHAQGMGCGLEDRGITDRYEAMAYGFQEGLDQMAAIIDSLGPLYQAPSVARDTSIELLNLAEHLLNSEVFSNDGSVRSVTQEERDELRTRIEKHLGNTLSHGGRETFQRRVQPWLMECFGATIAGDQVERNHRFLEEALELVQACGCTADESHKLVDYVFGRPVGEKAQEVGGVMVTLAALCLAQGLDMHKAGEIELSRITDPAMVERIREKQKRKPAMSPLPGSYPERQVAAQGWRPAIRIELVSASPGSGLHIRVWNDLAGLEPGTYELYLPVQP